MKNKDLLIEQPTDIEAEEAMKVETAQARGEETPEKAKKADRSAMDDVRLFRW